MQELKTENFLLLLYLSWRVYPSAKKTTEIGFFFFKFSKISSSDLQLRHICLSVGSNWTDFQEN